MQAAVIRAHIDRRNCTPLAHRSFKSADVAYVLAYSVIMLNTDAHNPQVRAAVCRIARGRTPRLAACHAP